MTTHDEFVAMVRPHLTEYRSFKVVRAGMIVEVFPDTKQLLVLGDENGKLKTAPHSGLFARGTPSIGDYYVLYDDGYVSWSPRTAFEQGYVKLKDVAKPSDQPNVPPNSSFMTARGNVLYVDMDGKFWHFNIASGTYRPASEAPPKNLEKGPDRGIGWAVKQMLNGSLVKRKGWAISLRAIHGQVELHDGGEYILGSADILAADWEIALIPVG